jgi:hypothetical protein
VLDFDQVAVARHFGVRIRIKVELGAERPARQLEQRRDPTMDPRRRRDRKP